MAMVRLTKHEQGIIVETFYGIDPETFEVERISLTRGGVLRKSGKDGGAYEHLIEHNRSPQEEVIVVWNLREVVGLREGVFTPDQVKETVERLKVKAAAMKAEAEAKK